ncbi:RHS repeat-associated core domain-containing protein [Pseudomonas sp. REB1044]|uniref:RHS repeat-associated core domain-containing protein n=1 Tax=Pseudomonas sp. REB1044 TaxID=2675224 RepID=UPI00315CAD2B
MTTSTHNGKVNFQSYIESGVDPRTLTFSANILLGTLVDPSYDIRLCYSPLNQKDLGMGKGWRVPATVFNKKTRLLSLSDGRIFQLDEKLNVQGSTGDIFVQEEAKFGYRVTYRNTDIIEFLSLGETDLCPCTYRYNILGKGIVLDWEVDKKSKQIKLKGITSESAPKEKLLTIEYREKEVDITLWPGQPEQKIYSLKIRLDYLFQLVNQSINPPLVWEFSYERAIHSLNRSIILSSVQKPSGHWELVSHDEKGRVFHHRTADGVVHYARSARDANQRLTTALQVSYKDELRKRSIYTFSNTGALSSRNEYLFLEDEEYDSTVKELVENYSSDADELPDAIYDNIHRHIRDIGHVYSYFNSYTPPQRLASKTINYTYDKFFSITSEITLYGTTELNQRKWKYDEYARLTESEENQEKKQFIYATNDAKSKFVLYATHIPDTSDEKTFTQYHYVPSMQNVECKNNKSPFKSQTTLLPKALIISRFHAGELEHQSVDCVESYYTDCNDISYLQIAETTSFTSTYTARQFDDPDIADLDYGARVLELCNLHNPSRKTQDAASEDSISYAPLFREKIKYAYSKNSAGRIERSATLTTQDGLTTLSTDTVSSRTGLILQEQDVTGNVSCYEWDALGRLVKTVNNPGSEFETTETHEHGLKLPSTFKFMAGKTPDEEVTGYILHTDTSGTKTLSLYNSNNQEIEVWECSSAAKNEWHCLQEKRYGTNGVKTAIDYDYSGSALAKRTSLSRYVTSYARLDVEQDSLGGLSTTSYIYTSVIETDRMVVKVYFDNSAVTEGAQEALSQVKLHEPIDFTYTRATGVINKMTVPFDCVAGMPFGVCETQVLDKRGNVIKVLRSTLSVPKGGKRQLTMGKPTVASQTYTADRRTSVTDELGHTTEFAYDVFGRHVATTYADGSQLSKHYSAHTSKALIEQIALTYDDSNCVCVLGEQRFDGLERLATSKSTSTTVFTYTGNRMEPETELSARGTLTYESIPELGSAVKSIKGEGLHHQFDYMKSTGLLHSFQDQSGLAVDLGYGALNHLNKETVKWDDKTQTSQSWNYSPNGKPTHFTDIAGVKQTRKFDARGNVIEIDDQDIKSTAVYGSFNRIKLQTIESKKDATKLTIEYSYNALGEEIERLITPTGKKKAVQVLQSYHKNHQLAERTLMSGGDVLRKESFTYDVRNMLSEYTCTGTELTRDAYGKSITKLELFHDPLGNLLFCTSYFGTESDTATFHYDNPEVPCQLTKVTHTHADYPAAVSLEYDANGCMTKNEKGQSLTYDALNRLASVKDGKDTYLYHYDPQGRLRSRRKLTQRKEWYYDPSLSVPRRVSERQGKKIMRLSRLANHVCGITHPDSEKPLLIGPDRLGTPLITLDGSADPIIIKCSPFGISDAPMSTGWNGELYDEVSGVYHLGERQYSPTLMRFTTPDSWSPFDSGGYNAYAYLDPINCPDPDGHISTWGWIAIAFAVVFAIVLGVLTMGAGFAAIAAGGMSLAAGMMVAGGALLVASGAVAIAAEVVRDNDAGTAKTLDWVAFGLGIAGSVLTLGAGFVKGAAQTAMRGVRSAAPRIGRMSRYAVREATTDIPLVRLNQVLGPGERAMQAEFINGSIYGFGTASSMVSGVQTVGSTVVLELVARLTSTAPFRLVGMTMGMEALLGLGIAARHHHDEHA